MSEFLRELGLEFTGIAAGAAVVLVFLGIATGLVRSIRRNKKQCDGKTVRVHEHWLESGLFILVGCLALIAVLIFLYDGESLTGWWVGVALLAVGATTGIGLIIFSVNYFVIAEVDHFIFRDMWRKTYYVPYESIKQRETIYKNMTLYYVLHTDEKAYRFDTSLLVELRSVLSQKIEAYEEKENFPEE